MLIGARNPMLRPIHVFRSEEEDDDEDYDPNAPVDESELMNDDVTSFLGVLQQNREKRAKEEEANKAKLRAEYKVREGIGGHGCVVVGEWGAGIWV